MGYKASLVIINQLSDKPQVQLLEQLGFTRVKPAAAKQMGEVLMPRDGKIYLGTFNNCTLLCVEGLATELIEDNNQYALQSFAAAFPGAEVCALALHSVVNYWAYAVIKDGVVIRARAGSADGGTHLDTGESLVAEATLLSKATLNADSQRTYMLDGFDEPLTEDAVGEEFVFALMYHYLNDSVDVYGPLRNLKLQGYSYSRLLYPGVSAARPWWKFW